MFDTLFRYPAIVARHQGGRFAAARELFLNQCAGQGMAHATLQRYAQELLVVAQRIDITVGEALSHQSLRPPLTIGLESSTNDNARVACAGRGNSSFKQPMASLLMTFGGAKTQDRAFCGPGCRFCRISSRRARFVPSHRPESELAREKFLRWLGEQESFARRCFPGRCGWVSGCQRKTGLGPHDGQMVKQGGELHSPSVPLLPCAHSPTPGTRGPRSASRACWIDECSP